MDPLLRFLLFAFLPLLLSVTLLITYLGRNPPRWRAVAESLLPPLAFARRQEYPDLGDKVLVFLRLGFTLGCFALGVYTVVAVLGPSLPEIPWVLGALVTGTVANAILAVGMNALETPVYRQGEKSVRTHEWRMKATGTLQRAATVEEVHEHRHGDGSWQRRQTRVQNGFVFIRIVLWLAAAGVPAAYLARSGISPQSCTAAAVLTLIVGAVAAIKLARS